MGLANLCRRKRPLYLGIVMLIIALLTLTVGKERLNTLRSLWSREFSMGDTAVNWHSALRSNDVKPGNASNSLGDYDTYPCISGLSLFSPEKWASDGKCLRTVNVSQIVYKTTTPLNCVTVMTFTGLKMPMCIYPAALDKWVSGNIVKGNLWEGDLVAKMTKFLKSQAGVEFLDLGSNIGSYSLALAHEGINMTAIDPLHSNMELLSKSISLGKLHDKITLIWNAVANHHNIVSLKEDLNNVGGTQITDIKSTYYTDNMDVARAITFDDLLTLFKGKHVAIKMDIEGSEYIALLGGKRFFDEVAVRVIQMEISFHSKGKDGQNIIDYLSSKGFCHYGDLQKRFPLNGTEMSKWPNDIYFLKPDSIKCNTCIYRFLLGRPFQIKRLRRDL